MSYCPLCHLPPDTRRQVDKAIVATRTSFMEISRVARCSRRAVTKHSKHLIEVLHEERKQAPIVVNFAPTINVYVVSDLYEEEQVDEEQEEVGLGGLAK